MQQDLLKLYGNKQPVALDVTPEELKKLLNRLVMKIWKDKAPPAKLEKALASFYASEYWKAIEEGYGQQLINVDLNSPDFEMLRKLEQDVFSFSSAKSYQQLKTISQALLDEAGQLRTFTAFRNAAAEINNQFVEQWLRTEYNFAVASAQSASQWVQIEKTKDILPLLKYLTAGDERVRPEHQELEDVIRPWDDTFWDIYYPPNGWNCRCDVIQLDSGTITPLEKITLPDIKPLFMYNPGKKGFAFPPGHSYYDGLPATIRQEAADLWKEGRINRNDG